MNHHVLEIGLALSLIAIAALLSARLRFSIAPFLILAGVAVGPHAPQFGPFDLSFVETSPLIEFMGRIGVLFLLFFLGLEFSVVRLIRSGRSIAVAGAIYIAINFAAGLVYPWFLGWPFKEILVAAGITSISSSAIVAKIIIDFRRTAKRETDLILGIIMFEDVFLAVYLSVVSGLVLSGATSWLGVLKSVGISLGFMTGYIVVGRLIVPFINRALRIASDETFLLLVFASLFLLAGLGELIHVAEAIGALLFGLVLAETEHRDRLEHLVLPFRDLFGAMFFFWFGLTIDPFSLGGAVWPALGAVLITLLGNVAAGMLSGRCVGLSRPESWNVGVTIMARGEFSIIVANLAKAGNLLPALQPFAALYVLILSVLGPILTKYSEVIYESLLDRSPRQQSPVPAGPLRNSQPSPPTPDEPH